MTILTRASNHFDALDGQRGIAALMVLLGHASAVMLGGEHVWVPRKGLAVVFFFMLSGFVVASAYRNRIRAGMSVRAFMLRRVIRLYPLIVFGVAIGTAWFGWFGDHFWEGRLWMVAPLLNVVGLPSPLHSTYSFGPFPIDPPVWSLFFELLAYLAFPMLVRRLSHRGLIVLTASCFVGFALLDWRYFNAIPFQFVIVEAGAAFCGGLLLWSLFEGFRPLTWQTPSWALALAIVLVCTCPLSLGCLVDYAALLLVFPAVIVLGAAKGRGVATPSEKLLGDLSFPVYILHWPFLLAAHRFIQPAWGAGAAITAGLIAAVTFSWLVLRFYDEPVRAWLASTLLASRPRPERVTA